MADIFHSTLLDIYLLKYYRKSILFTIIIPVIFVLINRSLLSGISFSVTFMAMTSSYTFSISEKNNMNRLYGVLPVSKFDMVMGRYILLLFMGIFTLLISLILESLALYVLNVPITIKDIFISSIVGIIFYIVYISFQLPGYYKFGSIRGRIFMYIPVLGFLLTLFVLGKREKNLDLSLQLIHENMLLFIIFISILLLTFYITSALVSINILKNKED